MYKAEFLTKEQMPFGRFICFETCNASHILPPPGYLSKKTSQFLEHSPYCERDLRTPEYPLTYDELGDYEVRIKALDGLIALRDQPEMAPMIEEVLSRWADAPQPSVRERVDFLRRHRPEMQHSLS